MRPILLILLAGLTACGGHDLASPSGKVFAFNPGQWTPTSMDLVAPRRVAP